MTGPGGAAGHAELERLNALASAAGGELVAAAAAALADGTGLRAGSRLRADGVPADLVAAAFAQAELRGRAAAKFSRAAAMFLTRAGLEQASGEAAARHRAARFPAGAPLADLCTGVGGDLVALAARAGAAPVRAVDLDPVHLRAAELNAGVYGVGASLEPVLADVRDAPLDGVAGAVVDPARRGGGRRFAAGASEPPLSWCTDLAARVPAVAVKAAPGLDHALAPHGWELEFVAAGRELKEAVLWSPALSGGVARRASVLPSVPGDGAVSLVPSPGDPLAVAAPGPYLLDPSPAVTRAGLVAELGRAVGGWQVDPRIAFLSTGSAVDSPFARVMKVERELPWHERAVRQVLREMEIGALDIRRRGLAGDVDDIRRRLRPRGPRRATLVMTRVLDRPWAFVCVPAADT